MGHTTLGVLPKTRYWTDVVDLLAHGAATKDIVAASARAAERDLLGASSDPVFVETVRLLLEIPAAARSTDFGDALRVIGLNVPDKPELLDIVYAVSHRLDTISRQSQASSDMGELASRALASTLSATVGDALPGLFAATPADVQAAIRNLSWNKGVAEYSRRFFGTLLSGTLSYWLDRTLDAGIGPDERFSGVIDRNVFSVELEQFSWESSRIIKEFSGGWYGKTLHRDGGFSSREAATFGHVALKKIIDDLRTRQVRRG